MAEPRNLSTLKSLAVTDFDSLTNQNPLASGKSQAYYAAQAAQICADLIAMDLERTMQQIKPLTPEQRALAARFDFEIMEFERQEARQT